MDAGTDRLMLFAFLVALVTGLAAVGLYAEIVARLRHRPPGRSDRVALGIGGAGLLAGCLAFGWGVLFEADWLEVTRHEVSTSKLPAGTRLRVVHLTDLHVDRMTKALEALPGLVNGLEPDLVVYTGDSLNAAEGLPVFRGVLAALRPRLGIVAVRGNHDVWYWPDENLFGGVAHALGGSEPLRLGPVAICGADYGVTGHLADCIRAAGSTPVFVAYHTPDLVEDLAPLAPLAYFAGHTHGGQVRVPFYGALVTMSAFDKKYEAGLYQVADTSLYVSRGIGFEPEAPRVRFLCRPEIALLDFVGTGSTAR